jgi:hypothetical protein
MWKITSWNGAPLVVPQTDSLVSTAHKVAIDNEYMLGTGNCLYQHTALQQSQAEIEYRSNHKKLLVIK